MKNFAERLNALRSIVKPSNFSETVVEAKKVTKEDIPEVNKAEGVDAMKNFAKVTERFSENQIKLFRNEVCRYSKGICIETLENKLVLDKLAEDYDLTIDEVKEVINEELTKGGLWDTKDFAESTEITKKVTKEDIENAENEAVLAEMKARKAIAEKSIRDAEMEVVNFAEDKKDDKGDLKDHDAYYKAFLELLFKAEDESEFVNMMKGAQDPAICNRILDDKDSIKKLGEGEGTQKDLRKKFLDQVKKTHEEFDSTYDNMIKALKEDYIAKSVHYKGDLEKAIIAIKYLILSGSSGDEVRKKVGLNSIIANNPGLIKELVDDKDFMTELKNRVKNAKESKHFAAEAPEYAKKILDAKDLDEFIKSLEDASSSLKDIKDEDYKKLELGGDSDKEKNEKRESIKKFYVSPEDRKKSNELKIKEYEETKKTKYLSPETVVYLKTKIEDAKKKGLKISEDASDAIKSKLSKIAATNLASTKKNLNTMSKMLEGMDEPGKSFCNAILGHLQTSADMKYATNMDLIESNLEKAAKKLNSEAIKFEEDDGLSLGSAMTQEEVIKVAKDIPDEEVKSADPESDLEKVSKNNKDLGEALKSLKKPNKSDFDDKEAYKAALKQYKATINMATKVSELEDKKYLAELTGELNKIRSDNDKYSIWARAYNGLKTVASDLKDGAKDLTKSIGELSKDLGDAFSNSADGIKASGEAVKSALEGIGEAGKDLLEGGSLVTESIGEAIKKAGDTDMTPDQIAAEAEKICKEKDAKVAAKIDWAKAKEALRDEKFMNKLKESIENAKADAEKKSVKWSSKLDKITAKGLMDIAKAENKGDLEVANLDAKKNIKEAEAALDIAKTEIKANKEMTENELEAKIESQLIEQKKDKKMAKLMAKAAVKMCKQDTKSEVKANKLKNQSKVDEAAAEHKIDKAKMNSAIKEANKILKAKDKITKSEIKKVLKEKLSDEEVDSSVSEAFIESMGDDLDSVLEESAVEKYTKEVAFEAVDPMESIINGELTTSTKMQNFSIKSEFKDYENTLNKWWDLY